MLIAALCLSMCTRSYELKIVDMTKFHAFLNYLAIPYMGLRVSGVKLVISPIIWNLIEFHVSASMYLILKQKVKQCDIQIIS